MSQNTVVSVKKDASHQASPHIYKPRRGWLCCTVYKDRSSFQNILQELELSEIQKQIIRIRYLSILENFQRRSRNYSYIFFSGHFIVTVGSLFVPALLSIQNSDKSFTISGDNFAIQIYWSTFVISLLVTIFNGILTLFKVDKKYYFLNTTLERLRTEGWQFFSLTGRYDGRQLKDKKPTHQNQFGLFMHYVEKFKMKQVEEEYYKADEKTATITNGNQHTGQQQTSQDLYPPSPDQPLSSMNNIPEPVREALNALIKSQTTVRDRADGVTVIPEGVDTASVNSRTSVQDNIDRRESVQDNIDRRESAQDNIDRRISVQDGVEERISVQDTTGRRISVQDTLDGRPPQRQINITI